jgi:ribosome biogenesis protein ERB1
MKIVRAIRQGRIVPSKTKAAQKLEVYSIWSEPSSSHPPPLPAPKPPLPTNSESYNPPEEYLPTEEEQKAWETLDPEDRERDYLPKKYSSLRLVPAYDRFIKDRFNRQLDLYMAPRIQRVKLNIDPNTLIPKLPSPSSLKPFPIYRSLSLNHAKGRARALSISPDGLWVISGNEGGVVSLWEVNIGREVKKWTFEGKIGAVEWCPRTDVSYFAVAMCVLPFEPNNNVLYMLRSNDTIQMFIPPNVSAPVLSLTQSVLAPTTLPPAPSTPSLVKWVTPPSSAWSVDLPILTIHLPASTEVPTQLIWHRRGDYFATVCT